MLTITVFKDEAKWSADLRKSALNCGLNKGNQNAWEDAKKITTKVDFTQSIRLGEDFFDNQVTNKIFALAHDIANGRNFKTALT